jgi:hydroxymethylpyrimidine pyrophosphatase-like HAD family hydrolase
MIDRLRKLLDLMPVAVLTAANFPRMQEQFLNQLASSPFISRMYVFSNVCSECYTWQEGWQREYLVAFTPEQHAQINKAIEESVAEIKLVPDPRYKPVIMENEGKVAYAALGLTATQLEILSWDPLRTKRTALRDAIAKRIDFAEISVGGATTVDITPKGIDKAYGVHWLAKHLNIEPKDMLYMGDALFEGGNYIPVIPTGIQTRSVAGPDDTLKAIDELLASCAT